MQVSPAATTTYTITATGPGGTATADVTVTVSPRPSNEYKITAGDATAYDHFGNSVSISVDYAIVGAKFDQPYYSGSAYIFKRDGTSWIEQTKITPSDTPSHYHRFGWSVSVSGDYAIVGAPHDDHAGDQSGSAYIFKREGTTWTEQTKLIGSDVVATDYFGYSVSISGDYAIVGAWEFDGGRYRYSGSAYIFKRDGTSWTEQAKLKPSDAGAGDMFGYSVSISGNYVLVGAYGNNDAGSNSGSAYIFKREGEAWAQQAKITASDAGYIDLFGKSVSISGDYAIIGADWDSDFAVKSGSAYIFKREGTIWTQQTKITASDASEYDYFGNSVSISDGIAVVGAYGNDDAGSDSGSAYIFKRNGEDWIEQIKLTSNDSAYHDWYGISVSVSGNYVMIGAEYNGDSGSAYIYDLSTPSVTITAFPEIIQTGEAATLSWSAANVDSISIAPGIGTVSAEGSVTVSPQQTTTYTITATGAGGTVTDSVTVYVVDPAIPPSVGISANPDTILAGSSFTLSWSASNATSCVIESNIGSVAISGSMQVSPAATTTYTITATGPAGTATGSVTVAVNQPVVPTVGISATPEILQVGGTATLTWNSTNATSCAIEPEIGSIDLNGSILVSPAAGTTYTITARGPGGTASASVAVSYPRPTVSIGANPATIQPDESITLTWSSTNAVSVVIEPGIGSVDSSGSMVLTPAGTTTYMITATGPGGTASSGVTVSVPSQLLLSITSPSNGATIIRPDVMVTGMIANAADNDVGVTVNGIVALVSGNLFAANHVPLTEGENIITVTSTAADGVTATTSIIATAAYAGTNYITITADPESGVSPLQTDLEVSGTFVITSPSITYTGSGTATQLSIVDKTYKMEIDGPGIYYFNAEAIDNQNITYTDTVAVQALDQAELDALLRAKWKGMKTGLSNSDKNAALGFIAKRARNTYEYNFNLLNSYLTEISAGLQDIELVQIRDRIVEYNMPGEQDGQTYSFYILFVKDSDGVWRIRFF
ncbi:MAG: hypothetical protein P1P89_11980 [Desulfobacterales bacterium]|nr:hypothetical protein [Desulfobacterales bacterium]